MTFRPGPGIYDRLLDQDLTDLLARYPELRPLFGKLEAEEQPSRYAEFVSQVLKQALLEEPDPEKTQQLHGAVCVFRTGQACEPSKGTAHPDGMAAEPSHASGDV